ncbi:flagellar export protein FliJ [Virgibacillus sp. C22-A2]|uniref:Flagellar FliJ protein n=1 Tax=Virgibacillus tibetensis TaxID=3042313 RepID=A0ABU6KBI0_9BACI|nr:flagellar export protein FliJ [Virgibacillus sp. C22-A2]
MTQTIALSKILHVREREKNDAQKAYYQSTAYFEEMATQLYNLLRRKEEAEETYEDHLQTIISLDKIREQLTFIEKLNSQILKRQREVQLARSDMESKQLKLTDAHVEVKKFEKIIEVRKKSEDDKLQKIEKASMDEISIQQYLSHKNR